MRGTIGATTTGYALTPVERAILVRLAETFGVSRSEMMRRMIRSGDLLVRGSTTTECLAVVVSGL